MSNRLTLFAGAAVVLVGLTAFLAMRADHAQEIHEQPVLAFPKLSTSGQELGKIVISGSSSKTTLVKQDDGTWAVDELFRYPAKTDLINRLYLELSTLTLLEKRSSKRDNQVAMDLGAPTEGGAGIEITAMDKSGHTLASIIQGKVKDPAGNGVPATLYVRYPGDDQAWFARSNLQASTAPMEWADKFLTPMISPRVSQIELRPSGPDPVVLRREKQEAVEINLQEVPKGRKQAATKVENLREALDAITFDNVKPKTEIDMTGAVPLRYSLFEGPVIDAQIKRIDGKTYATFSASSDKPVTDLVKKELADIKAKTSAYVFVLPKLRADYMTPSKEDLLEKPEAPASTKASKP